MIALNWEKIAQKLLWLNNLALLNCSHSLFSTHFSRLNIGHICIRFAAIVVVMKNSPISRVQFNWPSTLGSVCRLMLFFRHWFSLFFFCVLQLSTGWKYFAPIKNCTCQSLIISLHFPTHTQSIFEYWIFFAVAFRNKPTYVRTQHEWLRSHWQIAMWKRFCTKIANNKILLNYTLLNVRFSMQSVWIWPKINSHSHLWMRLIAI